jgi:hypothetical protein
MPPATRSPLNGSPGSRELQQPTRRLTHAPVFAPIPARRRNRQRPRCDSTASALSAPLSALRGRARMRSIWPDDSPFLTMAVGCQLGRRIPDICPAKSATIARSRLQLSAPFGTLAYPAADRGRRGLRWGSSWSSGATMSPADLVQHELAVRAAVPRAARRFPCSGPRVPTAPLTFSPARAAARHRRRRRRARRVRGAVRPGRPRRGRSVRGRGSS